MALLRIEWLPADPLKASANFHAHIVAQIRGMADSGEDSVTVLFAPESHDHADWRSAAIATIARALAPVRINGLVGDDEAAIAAALAYVEAAPGLTGQLLTLDGVGAGPVV